MNKIFNRGLLFGLVCAVFLSPAAPAAAYSQVYNYYNPTLSATYQGSYGNNVQITVSGGASYSQVSLYYRQSSSLWTTVNNIGQTDQSGYFTQVISIPTDSSGSTLQMYAVVGGQQTSTISVYSGGSGCGYYGCNVGGMTLSQTSLSLTVGQSASVTASLPYPVYGSSNIYVSNNSNSNVASASASGNTVTVYGLQNGSTTLTICAGSASSCASLYVTVSGYGGYGNLYFSPSSLTLSQGQSATAAIYGSGTSYGSYYISSNSNSNVASAYVSGSTLYVTGQSSGSTTIYVCQSGSNSNCASLYVTVSGGSCGYYGCGGNLSLSQTSVSLSVGQSASVTAYNVPAIYVSSNSNPSVVTASLNVNQINLYANAAGSSTVYVCALGSSSQCGNIYVTVSGSGTGSGSVWFNPSSPNLYVGQSLAVSINSGVYSGTTYGYSSNYYYVSSNSNPSVVTANISGSVLNLYANQTGSSSLTICHSSLSLCGTLYVTVGGSGYYGGYGTLSLSQTSLSLSSGQNASVNIYGSGNYYISSNTNQSVASASVSGSMLNVYANQNGSTTIYVCQSGGSNCANLYVTVSGGYYYGGSGLQYPGSNVLGASVYANGQLISENGTVYIVYKNTKTGFASAGAFTGLGYKFTSVLSVGNSGLVDSGYIIRSSYVSHPWGAWVKSGNTVYFVHEAGLIPVPDWSTFTGNGGQADFIVSANPADMSLPILSTMAYSDSRLR